MEIDKEVVYTKWLWDYKTSDSTEREVFCAEFWKGKSEFLDEDVYYMVEDPEIDRCFYYEDDLFDTKEECIDDYIKTYTVTLKHSQSKLDYLNSLKGE